MAGYLGAKQSATQVDGYTKDGADAAFVDPTELATAVNNAVADKATVAYVDAAVASVDVTSEVQAIVDAAPEQLNTLNELAAALGDDANFASTVTTQIGYETANRTSADTTLQSNIDAEASARASADSALSARIDSNDTDITNLQSAVGNVDLAVGTETSARVAADNTLQANINTQAGRIDSILSASSADKDSFAEIVTLINNVDTTNDSALGAEITARAAADTTLQSNINSEASTRAAADTALSNRITSNDTDITALQAAVSGNDTDIAALQVAVGSNDTDIANLNTAINSIQVTPAQVSDKTNTSTGFFDIPAGTTAQRPASPNSGYVRFNTSLGFLEVYSGSAWKVIEGSPKIANLSVYEVDAAASSQTVQINGENFSGASVELIAADASVVYPTTVTVNSSTQITITFSGSDVLVDPDKEPYSIRITTAGGSTVANNLLRIDNVPEWSTNLGNLGTVYEDTATSGFQLLATDPDNEAVVYTVTSGALPAGLELNQTSGLISGTPSVGDSYAASGVQHNFTVSASDGVHYVPRTFNILRKWYVGETAATAVNAANLGNLNTWGVPNGVYYIDLPNVGPTPFYIDNTYDGGAWILALSGDKAVGDGTASPPRNGVAAYANGDAFYTGTRGSNQNWTFDGHTLNTGNTELLFANLPYTRIRVAGNSFTSVDSSGFSFSGYYDQDAATAYKNWSLEMTSTQLSTHADKINNLTSWTQGRNAKQNLVYNQSWSTSYSAGNFKLGWRNTSGPSYGDYTNVWIAGGQAQRQGLSSALWREMHPGMSSYLHDSPTTVAVALGYAGHRGGGSHYNNSLWLRVS